MQLQQSKFGKILCVYAANQTYTPTIFEHLDSFRKYSKYYWHYLNISAFNDGSEHLESFDAVVFHYSVRLPFGQVSQSGFESLRKFRGLKVLFIQDEYDGTNEVKRLINSIPFDLVFSVVPARSLERVYPSDEFPRTRFVSNLTGYAPDNLIDQIGRLTAPSKRTLVIAYRGRPLPIRYGRLGQEKIAIGQHVRDYCRKRGIPSDIEWCESSRIYGDAWYRFIGSAKAMLGCESGSNVFDWDGTLQQAINRYRKERPNATDQDVYKNFIEEREVDGLMNQVSPRIFEMAAAKTVMVLFEGEYSGVLEPNTHFLPLKKDFSNLDQIFTELADDITVDAIAERAYQDIILSERYGYRQFVTMVDGEIGAMFEELKLPLTEAVSSPLAPWSKATRFPVKSKPPLPQMLTRSSLPFSSVVVRLMIAVWQRIPVGIRPYIKRLLGRA